MTMLTDGARSTLHSFAMFAFGFSLLLLAIWCGGCATIHRPRAEKPARPTGVSGPREEHSSRGHIVIAVRIVELDDARSLDLGIAGRFRILAIELARLVPGVGVQLDAE